MKIEVTTPTKSQIDYDVSQDVLGNNCNKRINGKMIFAKGVMKILDKFFISITDLHIKIEAAQKKLEEAEQEYAGLFSLLPLKQHEGEVKISEANAELAEAEGELKNKKEALAETETQLGIANSNVPPNKEQNVETALKFPKRQKNQNLNAILFILIIDFAVLLSSWSILRQNLSVDQMIHRSIIVLVISVIAFVLEKYYRQTQQTIHRILSAITLLAVVSSVFSGVLIDIFIKSAESSLFDDFSLSEIVQVDQTASLLQKYTEHPGILELLVAFLCFLIGKFLLKPQIDIAGSMQLTEQYYQVEDDPIYLWKSEVKKCTEMVAKAHENVQYAEEKVNYAVNEHHEVINNLYKKIEFCEQNIENLKIKIREHKNEFGRLLNHLWTLLMEYEELWRMRMSIKLGVSAASLVFETPLESDIFKHYNVNNTI